MMATCSGVLDTVIRPIESFDIREGASRFAVEVAVNHDRYPIKAIAESGARVERGVFRRLRRIDLTGFNQQKTFAVLPLEVSVCSDLLGFRERRIHSESE